MVGDKEKIHWDDSPENSHAAKKCRPSALLLAFKGRPSFTGPARFPSYTHSSDAMKIDGIAGEHGNIQDFKVACSVAYTDIHETCRTSGA